MMEKFKHNFGTRSVAAGATIFKEEDQADCAYLLISGVVEISTVRRGKRVKLTTITEGHVFGDLALIDDSPRSATAVALKNSELIVVTNDAFYKHIDKLDQFTSALIHYMAKRIRDLSARAML